MNETTNGTRLRGGIRPSRDFGEGRVCAKESCDTTLSR